MGLVALACVAGAVTWFVTARPHASHPSAPSDALAATPPRSQPAHASEAEPRSAGTQVPEQTPAPQAGSSAASGTSKPPPVLSLDAPPLTDAAGTIDPTVTLTGAKLPAPRPVDPAVAKELMS